MPFFSASFERAAQADVARLGLREHGDPSNESTGALPANAVRMFQVGFRAFTTFKPRPYDGRVTVFRSATHPPTSCDPLIVVRGLAAALDVYDVVGPHEELMKDSYVPTLALQMERWLAGHGPADITSARQGRAVADSIVFSNG